MAKKYYDDKGIQLLAMLAGLAGFSGFTPQELRERGPINRQQENDRRVRQMAKGQLRFLNYG